VVGRASRVAALGTLLGLTASWWVTGRMGALLVTPDVLTPRIFIAAGATMILLGIAAAWWPAWRAARLDPAVVLRSE
jgi:ABC-type antimicrobial peptide transport system permease subunit